LSSVFFFTRPWPAFVPPNSLTFFLFFFSCPCFHRHGFSWTRNLICWGPRGKPPSSLTNFHSYTVEFYTLATTTFSSFSSTTPSPPPNTLFLPFLSLLFFLFPPNGVDGCYVCVSIPTPFFVVDRPDYLMLCPGHPDISIISVFLTFSRNS